MGVVNQTKGPHTGPTSTNPSPHPFSHPPLLAVLRLDHDAHSPDLDRGLFGWTMTGDIPSGQRLAAQPGYGHGLRPQDPGR
jgi:hypothetical protein